MLPWIIIFFQFSFQCEDYCLNFIECCARGLGTRVDRTTMLVEHGAGGRCVKIRCLPISLTFGRYFSIAEASPPSKIPNISPNTKGEKYCMWHIVCKTNSISIFFTFINWYFYSLFLHLNLVILSVDNVDYTKGLNYRLNAFERFLEKYPVHQGKVVLVLILQPAGGREYLQLKETLDNMVYQINMRFSTTSWTPIHCIQRPVYEEELAGIFF